MYNSILESDYSIVENPQSDFYGVKLNTGKWKNVIITYGAVSIKECTETGYATLAFSYQIEDSGVFQPDELEGNEDFKNYLGDILSYIITSKEEELQNEEAID